LRAVTYVDHGRVDLVSRNGNRYKRFFALEVALAQALPRQRAISSIEKSFALAATALDAVAS
jgi:hypothetical protein